MASSTVAESEPAMWRRLTLTTVVSSISMAALAITAIAGSQRLAVLECAGSLTTTVSPRGNVIL